ncbi:MAG: pyridoxine 5'-phosphate synthase [Cytophagales bacterium]
MSSTRLSVNINKAATLRNARGGNNPDVVKFALNCEKFGAQGITVHPRPDERHIRFKDVIDLKCNINTELNIEGYPDERYFNLVELVKPAQATLVPDPPDAITSNTWWDTKKNLQFLKDSVSRLKASGCRVSIFLNPEINLIDSAKETGTDRIELYTEPYASLYSIDPANAIKPYFETAIIAKEYGLGVNAGHDLSLVNLRFFAETIHNLEEVSIGHALICDALYFGLESTIQQYLSQLK